MGLVTLTPSLRRCFKGETGKYICCSIATSPAQVRRMTDGDEAGLEGIPEALEDHSGAARLPFRPRGCMG